MTRVHEEPKETIIQTSAGINDYGTVELYLTNQGRVFKVVDKHARKVTEVTVESLKEQLDV